MLKFLFFFCLTVSSIMATEDTLVRRILSHLIIKDENSALLEAQKALKTYPQSKAIRFAHIQVLSQMGAEQKAFRAYREYCNLFPQESDNRELLEILSWGVINNAYRSPSPMLRIFALIAADSGGDAKTVTLLHKALDDPNSLVRQAAVMLASSMRDAKLCDKMIAMLNSEKDWNVRLATLQAIGKMKICRGEKYLVDIISKSHSTLEERAAASEALLHLLENVDRKEPMHLAHSSRSDLRRLCAMIIGHLGTLSQVDILVQLLFDSQAEVRKASLQSLGSFPLDESIIQKIESRINELQHDKDYEVAIYAAWLKGKIVPEKIPELFDPWLQHERQQVKIFASAALASLGTTAHNTIIKAFENTDDGFVKMNLAMALIKERLDLQKGLEALYQGLENIKSQWMMKDFTVFKAIAPSDVKHNHLIPNFPEVSNQIARLEVLNILAMLKYPYAKSALTSFLRERTWGITGIASSLLLTEGDESAIEIVKMLVEDSNPKVRIQAALVLALWGGDEKAIKAMQEAYPTASREVKEQIIEGIGRIGEMNCLPFLAEKLNEPFQSLRVMAASAILQCLYH